MALLSSRRTAVCAGLLLLAGCAMIGALLGGEDGPPPFGHEVHVVDQGMRCEACHEDAWHEESAGWPWLDTCLVCHEDMDREKPEELRVVNRFPADEEGRIEVAARGGVGDEVIFSHLAHVRAEVGCAECHVGIEESDRIEPGPAVDMAACVRCHEEREQATGCAACHREVDREWLPPSHLVRWERLHGHASRTCRGDVTRECSLCHDERSCADCHLVTPPSSHDHAFRTRTHGLHAALDRDTCSVCHTPDSCTQCHAVTEPRSHATVTFGGTRSTHCLGCHLPLRASGCQTCHPATPSHALASPKPDWHTPAMNCRQCHGITAPLPHVEKGDDCNACHH